MGSPTYLKMAKSSQRYYDSSPEGRATKARYQKKYNARPENVKKRSALNKYNRDRGTYGNHDGKDASHKSGKIVGFEAQSVNRARREKSRLKKRRP